MIDTHRPTSPKTSSAALRGRFVATVAASTLICREHFRLTLRLPSFPRTFPGQFIEVACQSLDLDYTPEHEFDWTAFTPVPLGGRELMSPLALLRRPLSLAGRRDSADGVELDLIHRVVGVGTSWLSRLAAGDRVHIVGPLGNHFELPGGGRAAILVGGGVGLPPMLYLGSALAGAGAVAEDGGAPGQAPRAILFAGAVARDLLPLTITGEFPPGSVEPRYAVAEFARHNIPAVITTDDGSYGVRGLVTEALEQYLDRHFPLGASPSGDNRPVLYTCGPEGMMKRVAQIAMAQNMECQVSVERSMACGMGTCQSCVIRVRKPDPAQPPLAGRAWCYKLACTDGPVFDAAKLLW